MIVQSYIELSRELLVFDVLPYSAKNQETRKSLSSQYETPNKKQPFLIMKKCIVLLALFLQKAFCAEWTVETFPEPNYGLISDPDTILSEQSLQAISETMDSVMDNAQVPLHVAIAVASQMKLPNIDIDDDNNNNNNNRNVEKAAETFARGIHDKWGVGTKSDSGGTGVLIFLSVDDRVVYISRGGSFDTLLRNSRIDTIIRKMKPSLRQTKYDEGLTLAVQLVGDFIEKGEPTWTEKIWDYITVELGILAAFVSSMFYSRRRARRLREEQRIYAEAASRLSEIDRAQAEALQGQYQATSCPVCLEDFVSDRIGSDNQPIKLLRCGHVFDETCWAEWVNSGHGDVSKCPICKKDVGVEEPAVENTEPLQQPLIDHDEHERARGNNRAMQLFQQERNFRLTRLALRYPNYITQNQVQRWSSPAYNGSLSRDSSFTESRPRVVQHKSHNDKGASYTSAGHFSGGTSSGGRGGRF
eukprot:scaffold3653_cov124-Cylindrotheca_fusiformis.AAC.2